MTTQISIDSACQKAKSIANANTLRFIQHAQTNAHQHETIIEDYTSARPSNAKTCFIDAHASGSIDASTGSRCDFVNKRIHESNQIRSDQIKSIRFDSIRSRMLHYNSIACLSVRVCVCVTTSDEIRSQSSSPFTNGTYRTPSSRLISKSSFRKESSEE
mmetsp:Transcript_12232/g.25918  ORF Transcript_12232/g.25918 Transcript_12232/m.25918 type:complete len:159 (+) Transcript_12232:645-1121(+)